MFISCIPSKLIEVGHYQCASETPFGWCFAGGLILAQDFMLALSDISASYWGHDFYILTIQVSSWQPLVFNIEFLQI